MNYYDHHIGDYDSATAHLTWLEDAAYSRLIRMYYRTEKPIPTDAAQVCRLVRATSKAEKQAVVAVLSEFFVLRDDGWHQKRCDEEIAKVRESGEESEAKRENERERQKRHRQRRKELFAALREHDIVPKFDTPTEQLETLLSQNLSRTGHGPVTRDSPSPVTDLQRLSISQEPLASSQQPKKNLPPTAEAPPSIWDAGLRVLTCKGLQEKEARGVLGKMRNEYGEDIVLAAVLDAQKHDVSDPVPWIRKACEARKSNGTKRGKEPDFSKLNYRDGVSEDGRF